jgi:hypothetical protein
MLCRQEIALLNVPRRLRLDLRVPGAPLSKLSIARRLRTLYLAGIIHERD